MSWIWGFDGFDGLITEFGIWVCQHKTQLVLDFFGCFGRNVSPGNYLGFCSVILKYKITSYFLLIIWDFLFIFELNNMLRKIPSNQTMSRMIAINDNLGAKLLKNKD